MVVVLGHIDHGKTTLLNAIRQIEFTGKKPGGVITQDIRAFQIEVAEALPHLPPSSAPPRSVKAGKKITFIDTPGHEAFSAMRSRGAKVADIALLVIDSCEGVKEQTKEAILDIKKVGIPLLIALNKIDKPEANPEKVKRELRVEGILVEEFGGKVPTVKTSAKTGEGINELLELILLIAEIEKLVAIVSKPAKGIIIESFLDSKRGPTATLILTEGILNSGEIIGTSSTLGKVKHLEDSQGKKIEKVEPSQPVTLIGFEKVPKVGETFQVFSDLESAQKHLQLEKKIESQVLEIQPGKIVLNLILKADVLGSLEAIEKVLGELPQDKVILRILASQVGEINENDVELAKSGKAIILGFRVKMSPIAKILSQRERIKIMNFEVIYDLVETVRNLIEKIGEPAIIRRDLGKIKVLKDFWFEKNRQIVGGRIIEGEIKKGTLIEIQRSGEVIARGKMVNLQKNKKDIERAIKGEEVGILYEGDKKIEVGDTLIIYQEERKK